MERIDREIKVIKLGESIDYFLILWDIVKWCRENDILTGIGRGSAGGSLVAYLLEITQLDPLRWGLLFERFLNEGRVKVSLPDIDTDFPGSDRNRVKEYMEQKYGASQVCSVGTYSALQLRAAIKDFSRLENIPFADVNYITGLLSDSDRKFEDLMVAACSNSRVKEFINTYPNMIHELSIILGAPKARSVHACAMMVSQMSTICSDGALYASKTDRWCRNGKEWKWIVLGSSKKIFWGLSSWINSRTFYG